MRSSTLLRPETVDEINRCEVGEGDFLLAERLAMHKGVESVFGFHVNCLGLGKPYWEKGVYLGDVLDFFDRHGETLIEKRAGSWHGDSTEVAKASECLQKGLAQFGLTLAQARERYGKREKLVDAADHIGYEWTGRAHGSLADALATLAVQRWLEQWLVAE